MKMHRAIEWLQCMCIAALVFVNAYSLGGASDLKASCETPKCTEVRWKADFKKLDKPPAEREMTNNERFDKNQAFTLRTDSELSGTPTAHATKKNPRRTGCSPVGRKCPAKLNDGTYEVSRWDDPDKEDQISNCSAKTNVDWKFCAGDDGEGVDGSWHEDKTKDQE